MICAKEVHISSSPVPLLLADYPLTTENIARLKALNFPGVYVKTKFELDFGSADFIDPALKNHMVSELKEVYSNITEKFALSNKLIKKMERIASDLVDFILDKEQYTLTILEIKSFDSYTYSHSINVSALATLIGLQLGYNTISLKELSLAGLMHDFGKLDVPINILNKPAPLNSFEFEIMKKHPEYGVNRLKNSMRISMTVLDGIGSHHERYDGSGYPNHLDSYNIPLCGRIIAVADVFDALTTSRVYRPAMSTKNALDYMASNSGSHFDPYIIDAFFKTVCVYPLGSMVKLSDASIAVVIENISGHMLDPVVKILSSHHFAEGEELDLSKIEGLFIIKPIDGTDEIPESIFE